MARVLVTGGAGFMGAHLTRELLDCGHTVTALDDLSGGFKDNVDPRATFVQGSVCDLEAMTDLFHREQFDHVYHLAAYAAEGLSQFIKHFNYTNNVLGSVNLINASVNTDVKCFVFTSSIAVYGKGQVPMTEELTPAPEDSYGIAKYTIEQELKASKEMFGLEYVIFRPHNVYGDLQNIGDRYRNVIGIFMNRIMQGKPLTIFGDGKQTRAFSYVRDIIPVIARAPEVREVCGQVFNIGADTPYTLNDLAATVCEAMCVPGHPVEHVEERNEVKHVYSDHTKVRSVFGEYPMTDLRTGISQMAQWARRVGARQSQKFSKIEVLKNLPPSWLRES